MNAPLKLATAFPADAPAEECEVDYGRACPTIPNGIYRVVFVHHETAYAFRTAKVFLWFRIIEEGPYFGRMIYAAYRARKLLSKAGKGGRFKLASGSELFRTICRVLDVKARPDRISVREFQKKVLRVAVRTVKTDYRQRELPEALRYSVVEDIIERETG